MDLVQLATIAIPSVFGFLALRAVKGMDRRFDVLERRADSASSSETDIRVKLAELQARVVTLEIFTLERKK